MTSRLAGTSITTLLSQESWMTGRLTEAMIVTLPRLSSQILVLSYLHINRMMFSVRCMFLKIYYIK